MSYKPDDKDWMAYLYGELDEADKRRFDQYILESPDGRRELERFQNLRQILSGLEDKEVIAPPIVIDDRKTAATARGRQRLWQAPYFRAIASIAASLIVVILVGKITGTQLVIVGNELRLSFGAPGVQALQPSAPPSLTEDEVRKMIQTSLEKNNMAMQASLEETQKELDASIRRNVAASSGKVDKLVREASLASQDQIRQFVDGIRTENMQQVKDYFQLTSTEQKKYIENLLVDFAKYLQQQRNDDLRLVETRLKSLQENTDLFKQETEQILTSIITTVGTSGARDIKN